MPILGTYAGDADNVTDHGSLTGWAPQPLSYGATIHGRRAYCFGPVVDNYGTWGQFIYQSPATLSGQDMGNPTGLTGHMPTNFAPDESQWIQGHLINGECGGRGSMAANLAPISHNINMMHKNYESTVQRLANCGPMLNSQIRMFNPNNIPDSWIIYRTHRLPGPAGQVIPGETPRFPNVPNGVVVSLGIVINGVMQSEAQVTAEFGNDGRPPQKPRWFGAHYYNRRDGASDRQKILAMLGGVELNYV